MSEVKTTSVFDQKIFDKKPESKPKSKPEPKPSIQKMFNLESVIPNINASKKESLSSILKSLDQNKMNPKPLDLNPNQSNLKPLNQNQISPAPKFQIPSIKTPSIKTPSIKTPSIKTPNIKTPSIHTSSTGKPFTKDQITKDPNVNISTLSTEIPKLKSSRDKRSNLKISKPSILIMNNLDTAPKLVPKIDHPIKISTQERDKTYLDGFDDAIRKNNQRREKNKKNLSREMHNMNLLSTSILRNVPNTLTTSVSMNTTVPISVNTTTNIPDLFDTGTNDQINSTIVPNFIDTTYLPIKSGHNTTNLINASNLMNTIGENTTVSKNNSFDTYSQYLRSQNSKLNTANFATTKFTSNDDISDSLDKLEEKLKEENSSNLSKDRDIGDLALEQIMNLLGEGTFSTNPIVSVGTLYPLIKDFSTIIVRDPNSTIVQYSVYTLSSQNITYAMCVVYKKDMDLPLILYGESDISPSTIVDTAYMYDVGRNRTLSQKTTYSQQDIPERIKSLLSTDSTNTNINYTGDVLVDYVDPELISLNVLIKNKQYVSTAPYEKLVAMSDLMITF
jgi:hypothetical protein